MTTVVNLKKFLLFSAISCFLSVITTIGIHSSLFDLGALSFEQRLHLFENKLYIANRFWIIAHCLFVLISMWGFCLVQFKESPGFAGLGFVFFSVFSFTEIFRQMFVLFYLNNLRRSFLEADTAAKEMIGLTMEHAGLIGYALFGLFIVSFALGNIFYGLGLFNRNRVDTLLAVLLLLWGFGNLIAFGNEFWESALISKFLKSFNIIYQPFMRILIGLWLLYKIKHILNRPVIVVNKGNDN